MPVWRLSGNSSIEEVGAKLPMQADGIVTTEYSDTQGPLPITEYFTAAGPGSQGITCGDICVCGTLGLQLEN